DKKLRNAVLKKCKAGSSVKEESIAKYKIRMDEFTNDEKKKLHPKVVEWIKKYESGQSLPDKPILAPMPSIEKKNENPSIPLPDVIFNECESKGTLASSYVKGLKSKANMIKEKILKLSTYEDFYRYLKEDPKEVIN